MSKLFLLTLLSLVVALPAQSQEMETGLVTFSGTGEYEWEGTGLGDGEFAYTRLTSGANAAPMSTSTGCDVGRDATGQGLTSTGPGAKIGVRLNPNKVGQLVSSTDTIAAFRIRICARTQAGGSGIDPPMTVRPYVKDVGSGQVWDVQSLGDDYAFHLNKNVTPLAAHTAGSFTSYGSGGNFPVTILDVPVNFIKARDSSGYVKTFEVGLIDVNSSSAFRPVLYRVDVTIVKRTRTSLIAGFAANVPSVINVDVPHNSTIAIPVTTTQFGTSPFIGTLALFGDSGLLGVNANNRLDVSPVVSSAPTSALKTEFVSGETFFLRVNPQISLTNLPIGSIISSKFMLVMEADGEVVQRQFLLNVRRIDPLSPPPPPPPSAPPPPAFLIVERIANNGTELNWGHVPSATHYIVEGSIGGGSVQFTETVPNSANPFLLDNRPYALTNNNPQTNILYKVKAVNASGSSPFVSESCIALGTQVSGVCSN